MLNHSDALKPDDEQQKLITEATLILDWMEEVVGAAFKEARDHRNTSVLNRLAKNDSFNFFITNVHGTRTVPREQFARQYPGLMKEASELYHEYQERTELKEAVTKITPLEEQLKELKGMFEAQAEELKALKEAQNKPAEPAKPAKKADKPADAKPETDEAE